MEYFLFILSVAYIIIQLIISAEFIEEIERSGYQEIFQGMPVYGYIFLLPSIIVPCTLGYIPYRKGK